MWIKFWSSREEISFLEFKSRAFLKWMICRGEAIAIPAPHTFEEELRNETQEEYTEIQREQVIEYWYFSEIHDLIKTQNSGFRDKG